MLKTKKHKDSNTIDLILEGDCSIQTVTELYNGLKLNLKEFEIFNVKNDDVESLDLATIQVLISFKKQVEINNKTVNFNFSFSEEINETLTFSGLNSAF